MLTKTVVEDLLYISKNKEQLISQLKLLNIINKTDRNWVVKKHNLEFIDNFNRVSIFAVVDKFLKVYIIGRYDKSKRFNIIKISGNNSEYLLLNKSDFRKYLKEESKIEDDVYFPRLHTQRIIYLYDNEIEVYNRTAFTTNLFQKSSWTKGVLDHHLTNRVEEDLSVYDILNKSLNIAKSYSSYIFDGKMIK